jgi:hypothetical protein
MAIWRCEDCHKCGFYFDITDAEMAEKHRTECCPEQTLVTTESVGLPEGGLYVDWSNKRII